MSLQVTLPLVMFFFVHFYGLGPLRESPPPAALGYYRRTNRLPREFHSENAAMAALGQGEEESHDVTIPTALPVC